MKRKVVRDGRDRLRGYGYYKKHNKEDYVKGLRRRGGVLKDEMRTF